MIKLYKITDSATFPTRGTEGAAGYDLYANDSMIIHAGRRALVGTGISSEFDDGIVGNIRPRSGLAVKSGIDTLAGVIDSDYRGEIKVLLINHGTGDFSVCRGDRIAQIVFGPCLHNVVEGAGMISETERGAEGFGHTGE